MQILNMNMQMTKIQEDTTTCRKNVNKLGQERLSSLMTKKSKLHIPYL